MLPEKNVNKIQNSTLNPQKFPNSDTQDSRIMMKKYLFHGWFKNMKMLVENTEN